MSKLKSGVKKANINSENISNTEYPKSPAI